MATLKQSTSYTRTFMLIQSADHITGLTAAAPTVTISKAGAAFAAAAGVVTEISSGWYKVALTAADTNTLGDLAYHITATSADPTDFVDQVTAQILGDTLTASIATPVAANVSQWNGTAVAAPATAGIPDVNVKNFNNVAAVSLPTNFASLAITAGGAVTVGTNSDKTGYSLTQAFPANFASMAITVGGAVTVGTNSDKTGYSLTQAFPANFASTAITVGGAVTVGTNNDKTGYSLTQTFPTNFSVLAITAGGAVTAGTVSDKTGYSLTQTFPANFASLAITAGGAVTAGTVSDKTGYSLTQAFPANFGLMSIDTGGNVSITSNIKKNTLQNGFTFVMTSATAQAHTPLPGLTVTATRSLDGAPFAACANPVSEVGNGTYTINLAAVDTNANHIALRFTATGADDLNIEIVTQP